MRVLYQRDLEDICTKDPILKKCFGGVKARGESINMSSVRTPIFFIYNNDFREEEGRHWILIMYFRTVTIYFDSFGFSPYLLGFRVILEREGVPLISSVKPVQSPLSTACGYHVIFVALQLMRKYSLYQIQNTYYSNNLTANDDFVFKFWEKRLWKTQKHQIL